MKRIWIGVTTFLMITVGFLYFRSSNPQQHGRTDFASYAKNDPVELVDRDLLKSLTLIQDHVQNDAKFNLSTCATDIAYLEKVAHSLKPEDLDVDRAIKEFDQIINTTYDIRQKLRKRLSEFVKTTSINKMQSNQCVSAIRTAMRILRYIEDYILLTVKNVKEFDSEKDKPGPILRQEPGMFLIAKESGPIKLRSGDLIMSRGNAYTSAAISRIGKDEAQFSHLAVIYFDAPVGTEMTLQEAISSSKAFTVESHIEIGSFYRSFKSYSQDGNTRAVLYRFKESPEKAHYAAGSILKYVHDYQRRGRSPKDKSIPSVNSNPPYDFQMDGNDHSAIFCAELVSMAYAYPDINIPQFPSLLKVNAMTRSMGITKSAAFAPVDMEVESQFEQLAEWRDLRKLNSVLKKDVALSSIFRWMEQYNYQFHSKVQDQAKAFFAWTVRQTSLGFKQSLPKNMTREVIRMTFSIERSGEILENQLNMFEEAHRKLGRKLKPGFNEQMKYLEKFRVKDLEVYNKNQSSNLLHSGLRP